ncbi:MAG: 2Fe-2S iron-sulfur cluster-binding protein [Burkholderiaceae bacterium]
MITVHFVSPQGDLTSLQGSSGQNLMQLAVSAGLEGLAGDCGGLLTCATCHVMVREPHASLLPPPGPEELSMLEFTAVEHQPNSRLGCQIVLEPSLEGLTVELPSTQY